MRQVGVIVMGNNQLQAEKTWLEDRRQQCLDRAQKRLTEYSESNRRPLKQLSAPERLKDYLRPGDILGYPRVIKTDVLSISQDINEEVLITQYGIYVKYLGNDKHQIIEKKQPNQPYGEAVFFSEYSSEQVAEFNLVVNSRYQDTLQTALWIEKSKIDGGYGGSHSNSEHFVTFCLTRCTLTSSYGQKLKATVIRDFFAKPSCFIGNSVKIITHPFYIMGGDMTIEERIVKTAVPFGMDGEKIGRGKTIMIGSFDREMWHYWLEIDREPSGQTLHQLESKWPEDDHRVIKYHR